ncbi:hypothetical protein EJV47_02725 [Hymenobacter gummosus]|uniref:Uncharacterized protein n=1 Tax=Hymenobacter gummosus TaxID=1776032 RepID=A0A431U9F8_9BACT|nr:hypothetical protein [Hymenobacter gummosus]RTQ53668.1 hypothetical protein EJV47_02725 [Hymenobacter gummosus]
MGRVSQLEDGWYRAMHLGGADSLARQLSRQELYVQQHADTLLLIPRSAPTPRARRYQLRPDHHALLLNRRFDLDVFTIPVKVRPARAGVPVQLNTTFNAAVYLGRRLDFYYLSQQAVTPWHRAARIRATGLGYGAFLGLGSTAITADVTGRAGGPEYEGFVLHAGAATLYDARSFNVGLAAGLDHLLGPDRRVWIYQHRPWVGILFGLDLN